MGQIVGQLIGYARVSSDDQDLTVQLDQLKQAGCTRIFSEKKSGLNLMDRSELAKCLAYVREGDTLLVTRLDRFARSVKDFNNIITDLLSRGIQFRCLLQPFETDSPSGKLMMQMLAAFAEFETAVRRERQMEGIRKAQAKGVYKRTHHGHTTGNLALASRLLNQGLSYAQVEEKTGISNDALRRRFPNYVQHPRKKGKKGQAAQTLPLEEPMLPADAHPPSAAEAVESESTPDSPLKKRGFLGKLLGA